MGWDGPVASFVTRVIERRQAKHPFFDRAEEGEGSDGEIGEKIQPASIAMTGIASVRAEDRIGNRLMTVLRGTAHRSLLAEIVNPSQLARGGAVSVALSASRRYGTFLVMVMICTSCRRSLVPDAQRSPSTALGPADSSGATWACLTQRRASTLCETAAEKSGIDFVHDWVPPEDYPYDLETMMAGGGVAIGDYDADGLPDVYLARPQGGNRLYRNRGLLRFEDVTDSAGLRQEGFWGGGVTFVDIDNDADLDLYACGHNCPNRLYVNQGDGTFTEQAQQLGLDFLGASVMMAFADYDCDGDLDGYLLTNHLPLPTSTSEIKAALVKGRWVVPAGVRESRDVLTHPDGSPVPIRAAQFDHLFRNEGPDSQGHIHFVDVSQAAGIEGNHHGLSAIWWDYNHDGRPDLYVANDFTDPDHLYRNNGDGTFTDCLAETVPHTPWFSMGSDVADVNNDGRLDLLATDMAGTSHYKQKGRHGRHVVAFVVFGLSHSAPIHA